MSELKFSVSDHIIEALDALLLKRKKTRKELAKTLNMSESELIENLKAATSEFSNDYILSKVSTELNVPITYFYELNSDNFLAVKVRALLKQKDISFAELSRRIKYTTAGLHRAFSTGTLTIFTLAQIAHELEVPIHYFFEELILDRLAEEALRHPNGNEVKLFLSSLSRDISKGIKLEDAVWKNIDPDGYKKSLSM